MSPLSVVTNISAHGLWLLAYEKELFMPYDDFPWFKNQTIKSIVNVEEQRCPNTVHPWTYCGLLLNYAHKYIKKVPLYVYK